MRLYEQKRTVAIAAAIVACLTACGGNTPSSPDDTVVSKTKDGCIVQLSPSESCEEVKVTLNTDPKLGWVKVTGSLPYDVERYATYFKRCAGTSMEVILVTEGYRNQGAAGYSIPAHPECS